MMKMAEKRKSKKPLPLKSQANSDRFRENFENQSKVYSNQVKFSLARCSTKKKKSGFVFYLAPYPFFSLSHFCNDPENQQTANLIGKVDLG